MITRTDGCQGFTSRTEGERAITKMLDECNLDIIYPGHPSNTYIGKIKHNLIDLGFNVDATSRVYRKIEGSRNNMPVILLEPAKRAEN